VKTTPQDATMPRRSYSYARYSQGIQGEGDSERRQKEWPAAVSAEQGWCLDDSLSFVDRGRSGFHGANRKPTTALSHFLDLVQRGRITRGSVLIIENIDRLSRQDVDTAHDLFRSIIRAGVWICTRTPFRIYKGDKDSSFMDLLEPIWIMYCAYMESLKKSQRVAGAWEAARRQVAAAKAPHQCRPPGWIRRTGASYELVPEHAAAVRRMFALSREGVGSDLMCVRLAEEGFRPWGHSGRWSHQTIHKILTGRAAVGEYQAHRLVDGRQVPDGLPIAGYYPAAVSEDEWQTAQAAIRGRKKKCGRPGKGFVNLFTGLMRDQHGRPYSILCRSTAGKQARWLRTERTRGVSVPYYDAEACILDTLAMLRPEDVIEPSPDRDQREQRIATLTARLVALDHRQEQLTEACADPAQDAAPLLAVLRQVAADKDATALELEGLKLESLTGRAEALTEAQTLWQLRGRAGGTERLELDRRIKAALPSVVKEIIVHARRTGYRTKEITVSIRLRSGNVREVQLLPRGT